MLKQVVRFFGAAASIAALSLLAACGGGGGSPGATSPSLSLSPSALTISELGTDVDEPIRLTVFGAVGPFTVFSSDFNLLKPAVPTHPAETTAIEIVTGLNESRCLIGTIGVNGNPILAVNVTITVVDSIGSVASSVITIQNSTRACPLTP